MIGPTSFVYLVYPNPLSPSYDAPTGTLAKGFILIFATAGPTVAAAARIFHIISGPERQLRERKASHILVLFRSEFEEDTLKIMPAE
jgi:hypothetical protein